MEYICGNIKKYIISRNFPYVISKSTILDYLGFEKRLKYEKPLELNISKEIAKCMDELGYIKSGSSHCIRYENNNHNKQLWFKRASNRPDIIESIKCALKQLDDPDYISRNHLLYTIYEKPRTISMNERELITYCMSNPEYLGYEIYHRNTRNVLFRKLT